MVIFNFFFKKNTCVNDLIAYADKFILVVSYVYSFVCMCVCVYIYEKYIKKIT